MKNQEPLTCTGTEVNSIQWLPLLRILPLSTVTPALVLSRDSGLKLPKAVTTGLDGAEATPGTPTEGTVRPQLAAGSKGPRLPGPVKGEKPEQRQGAWPKVK